MQKWHLSYWIVHPGTRTHKRTIFEASARDLAQFHANIFFRLLIGHHTEPEMISPKWSDAWNLTVSARDFDRGVKVPLATAFLLSEAEYQDHKARAAAGEITTERKVLLDDIATCQNAGIAPEITEARIRREYPQWVLSQLDREQDAKHDDTLTANLKTLESQGV